MKQKSNYRTMTAAEAMAKLIDVRNNNNGAKLVPRMEEIFPTSITMPQKRESVMLFEERQN